MDTEKILFRFNETFETAAYPDAEVFNINEFSSFMAENSFGFMDINREASEDPEILSKLPVFKDGHSFASFCNDGLSVTNTTWNEERCDDGFVTTFHYVNSSVFRINLTPTDYNITVVSKGSCETVINDIRKPVLTSEENNGLTYTSYKFSLTEDCLTLQFEGEPAVIAAVYIEKQAMRSHSDKPVIYIASDSTVMTYKPENFPQTGWGQMLSEFFDDCIEIKNHAIGGRSSRSFVDEGRLDRILNVINPGDYLFIQFGHNDNTQIRPARYVAPKHFEKHLMPYINGARQRGAIPVLVSPVPMRVFNADNKIEISFKPYREVMMDMAERLDIPFLDLGKAGAEFLNEFGAEESKAVFLFTPPGVFPNYPNGSTDRAHYQRYGATKMAEILSKLIKASSELPELAAHVAEPAKAYALPKTPENISVNGLSSTSVTLRWDEAPNSELYYIYRALSGSEDFKRCGASAFTAYIDLACEENTCYCYKIAASNTLGSSNLSDAIEATTSSTNMKYCFNEKLDGYTFIDHLFDTAKGFGFETDEHKHLLISASNGDYSVRTKNTRNDDAVILCKPENGTLRIPIAANLRFIEVTLLNYAPDALRYYELNLDTTPPTVVLTWTPTDCAKSYKVYRKDETMEDFAFLYETKDSTYYEESASLGHVYEYYVTGVMDSGKETAGTNKIEVKFIVD